MEQSSFYPQYLVPFPPSPSPDLRITVMKLHINPNALLVFHSHRKHNHTVQPTPPRILAHTLVQAELPSTLPGVFPETVSFSWV